MAFAADSAHAAAWLADAELDDQQLALRLAIAAAPHALASATMWRDVHSVPGGSALYLQSAQALRSGAGGTNPTGPSHSRKAHRVCWRRCATRSRCACGPTTRPGSCPSSAVSPTGRGICACCSQPRSAGDPDGRALRPGPGPVPDADQGAHAHPGGGRGRADLPGARPVRLADVPIAPPFCDDVVVDACLRVSPHETRTPGAYKPLLTTAMRSVVPRRLLSRTTKDHCGDEWNNGLRAHADELRGLSEDSRLVARGLVDSALLRRALLSPTICGFLPRSGNNHRRRDVAARSRPGGGCRAGGDRDPDRRRIRDRAGKRRGRCQRSGGDAPEEQVGEAVREVDETPRGPAVRPPSPGSPGDLRRTFPRSAASPPDPRGAAVPGRRGRPGDQGAGAWSPDGRGRNERLLRWELLPETIARRRPARALAGCVADLVRRGAQGTVLGPRVIEVDGTPVGEPGEVVGYRTICSVPAAGLEPA